MSIKGDCVSISPQDDQINFPALQSLKERYADFKTLISIGGASHSTNLSNAAKAIARRRRLAQSCVSFMKLSDSIGIDVFWEFPSATDKQNYTALLAELRNELNAQGTTDGRQYLLTAGVPNVNNGLYQKAAGPAQGTWAKDGILDFKDLMNNYIGTYLRFWNTEVSAPWLYNPNADTFISYDDVQSVNVKADYVNSHDLAGTMLWRLSADDDQDSLTATMVRYYGFLANRYREEKLTRCRDLLGMPAPDRTASEVNKDYSERYEELTSSSLWECPVCHQGRMLVIEVLPRSPYRKTAITDTS